MEQMECTWICELMVMESVDWKVFIRLANFITAMCEGAVFSKFAKLLILKELALLCLEIIVRYVDHISLSSNWKLLKNLGQGLVLQLTSSFLRSSCSP